MRGDLPTGTVTFLFTDVEGSTELLHELGAEAYAEALAEHRRVVREACAAESGVEVDTQGDAFFLAFPTASGAVTAAQAMTEALAVGPIHLRIGVHTGTAIVTDDGYVGDDVHLAARVAASGHAGQVVVSQATGVLLENETLTDLGEHRLKDIEGTVTLFQLGDARFPPLKTISSTNLPRPASSFVGRTAELAEVLSLLDGGSRLVTLTGPGGSGKTRLALEAASTLVPSYKAGVFWIGLASLHDPSLVTDTIAQTLGAKDGLAEHLGDREMLLLLDNLEQVIDAAPDLASLLERCPKLTFLVTSRELLRVRGEVEYAVPPLAEPEAVELFCQRAQLGPTAEIAELCARLDNLPLAVELAAARTRALTPSQILQHLGQRLDLLKGGRDADPRQQTLRATMEWSYDLLTEEEKQLFARLSVFAGCTLEAANEITGADLDRIQSLVEKSLLRFREGRYWMLATVREHAATKLSALSMGGETKRLHTEHFTRLVMDADPHLRHKDQEVWVDVLEAEYANIRAALEDLHERDQVRLLECTAVLWWFWRMRGYISEGRMWLERGLQAEHPSSITYEKALGAASNLARLQRDWEEATRYAGHALEIARVEGDPLVVARALINLANISIVRLDFERAMELQTEAVELTRPLDDVHPLAVAVGALGCTLLIAGDAPASIPLLEESLTLHRRCGDSWGESNALLNLGAAHLSGATSALAERHFADALRRAVALGSDEFIAYALQGIAAVMAIGRPELAAALLGASRRLLDEAGVSPELIEERVRERALAQTAQALGDALVDALEAGAALDTEAALKLAHSVT